jgi:ABC-type transport system involved in cytochrome bd biosynthesis fused ATPase/permease subunit
MHLGLGIPEAVAALTALGLVVWPLRQLADVADRRRAFVVASDRLDRLLAERRMPASGAGEDQGTTPAVRVDMASAEDGTRTWLVLDRGEHRRLSGPSGSGKSALLLALAGFDPPMPGQRVAVFGRNPGALAAGDVLYLGRQAPGLAGSLRRELTLGTARTPDDAEIEVAVQAAGLGPAATRLGGLDGKVLEDRRNLTATEQAALLLARGLLARPKLALLDTDEIGLGDEGLERLLDHLAEIGAAALVVSSDVRAIQRLGQPTTLQLLQPVPATAPAGRRASGVRRRPRQEARLVADS